MAFGKGFSSYSYEDILKEVSELDIVHYYLGITKIPFSMCSPLRKDNNPSFGVRFKEGKVFFKDFTTNAGYNLLSFLKEYFHADYAGVVDKLKKDLISIKGGDITVNTTKARKSKIKVSTTKLDCKIRKWKPYDEEYWNSYGISLKWLKMAEVYPISHVFITTDDTRYTISADKYAYVFIERKDNKVTMKVYQPFNTKGYKWTNKHDSSTLGLWTKVPEKGDKLCICSSIKDALCLWENTGIPSICLQGEGYKMSQTAINVLKSRFKQIFICLDNDAPGLKDAEILSKETGFTNIVIPYFTEGKDLSDLYKAKGKETFKATIEPLFNLNNESNLPF